LVELVSFPLVFDFPGAEIPGRYYVGASIYLDGNQPPFSWNRLYGNQPILYCGLGGVLPYGDKKKCRKFFRIVIDSSSIRPDWQWVIPIGNNLSIEELGQLPSNVIVINHAPQLEIIKRASIVITHGGANTVKECIYFGVPMIIVSYLESPLALVELPLYTARVLYHGLGVNIDSRKLNVARLQNLVDTVDKDSYIRSQIKIMQAKFREIEEENLGVKLVEIILR
jgi:MGT family glycosyltransferase